MVKDKIKIEAKALEELIDKLDRGYSNALKSLNQVLFYLYELHTLRQNLKQAVKKMRKFSFGICEDEWERAQQDGVDYAVRILDDFGLLDE